MDNAVIDIEICKQCQHKDCRYCRFNPSGETVNPDSRGHRDDEPSDRGPVAHDLGILIEKAVEFRNSTFCQSCPISDECSDKPYDCSEMFLWGVSEGIIDSDGNRIKKRQPQD